MNSTRRINALEEDPTGLSRTDPQIMEKISKGNSRGCGNAGCCISWGAPIWFERSGSSYWIPMGDIFLTVQPYGS